MLEALGNGLGLGRQQARVFIAIAMFKHVFPELNNVLWSTSQAQRTNFLEQVVGGLGLEAFTFSPNLGLCGIPPEIVERVRISLVQLSQLFPLFIGQAFRVNLVKVTGDFQLVSLLSYAAFAVKLSVNCT